MVSLFSHFGLSFIKVGLYTVVRWFWSEGGRVFFNILHERIHAAECLRVDVILVAPVSRLCLIHRNVHIYLTTVASPNLCLRIL